MTETHSPETRTTGPFGSFHLEEPIGEGARGWVWRGRFEGPDERVPVAVKILKMKGFPTEAFRRRFRREVQAHAGLNHPAVADLYDYGELSESAGRGREKLVPGAPYIAMEFAEAGTLVDDGLPADWPTCRRLLLELLDGLAHAHARDVVHRDLKPENILAFPDESSRGRWKLTDFGVAYAPEFGTDEEIDFDTAEAGTPHYMAPEQFLGRWREFGPWTDLYQLGCVTYQLVSGDVPYDRDSVIGYAEAHTEQPLPELDPRFPVPDGLDGWIRTMAGKLPRQRFQRAADAARALESLENVDAPAGPTADDWSPISTATTLGAIEAPTENLTLEPTDGDAGTPPSGPTRVDPDTLPGLHTESRPELEDPALADGAEESAHAAVERPLPPRVPKTWKRVEHDGQSDRPTGVGLGLFELREVPFVDRDAERDAIWSELRDVVDENRPAGLVVEGESGTGKSRLAEWMTQRADELGACTVLKGTHDPQGGPGTDLRGLFRRWLRSWNLERRDIRELAERNLRRATAGLDLWRDQTLGDTVRDLVEFVRPPAETESSSREGVASVERRYAALRRILRWLSRARPVLVWLDDVHWADGSLDFVERFLDREPDAPVLFLMTERPDDERERSTSRQLATRDDVDSLTLDPLDDEDHAAFVDALLPLEPSLASTVRAHSRGNPLYAVQLVREWVSEGTLRPTPQGFGLRDGAEQRDVPESIDELWMRRIRKVVAQLPQHERSDNHRALELVAALGRQIDRREWRALLDEADLAPSDRLLETLADRGLVEMRPDTWEFAHSKLVEALNEVAVENGRWTSHNRVCADMLEALHDDRTGEIARRQAHHRIEAGQLEAALDPLLFLARWAGNRGDYEREARSLERREHVLDELDLGPEDRRRVENWARAGWNLLRRGELVSAEEEASRAARTAERHDWSDLRAEALVVLAGIDQARGDYHESIDKLSDARDMFDSLGDRNGLARCRRLQGVSHSNAGHFGRAETLLDQARRDFRELDNAIGALRCLRAIGWTRAERDQFDEAASVARELIDEAESLGASALRASGWNILGDLAKRQGNFNEAKENYRRALDQFEEGSSRNTEVVELNYVTAAIADRDFDDLRPVLEKLRVKLPAIGFQDFQPVVDVALVACAASQRDWGTWMSRVEQFERRLEEHDAIFRDLVWLTEITADITDQAGDQERASRLYRIAESLWRKLGNNEAAERIAERT